MRFLVFQHLEIEHPGIFRHYCQEKNITLDVVELDQGDVIPEFDDYDALWVMGGPMDVWETEEHPWLIEEKKAIKKWVEEIKRPFFGVCLGHQLLVDALGGTCGYIKPPEVGMYDIFLTEQGKVDPFFRGLPDKFRTFEWHGVEVTRLPANAQTLASSSNSQHQAIKVGDCAYGIQYHVELEETTIQDWGQIPAYAGALETVRGAGAIDIVEQEAAPHYDDFKRDSRQLFDNFLALFD